MKHSKLIALLLAMAMIVALFAACGGSSTPASAGGDSGAASVTESGEEPAEEPADEPEAEDEDEAENAEPAEEPAEGEDEAEDEEAEPAGDGMITTDYTYDLPLFPDDPDFTFSMWVSFSDSASNYMPNQFADNRAYLESVEKTGVEVEMVCISTSSNSEQFNLRVASGDLPNVITNVSMLWSGSFDSAIDDEVFIDLTEMVENYMPAYYECYEQLTDAEKKQLHTDEGNLPRLVSINNYPDGATEGAFIRTDYLEKVGLDIPETYDELDEVLHAFQSELNLSEPLMAVSGLVHTSNALCSGYGVSGGFSTFPMFADPYYVVDGEIKYGIIEEGYKEYMEMFNGWYNEGIISPDFISKNQNPMEFPAPPACSSARPTWSPTTSSRAVRPIPISRSILWPPSPRLPASRPTLPPPGTTCPAVLPASPSPLPKWIWRSWEPIWTSSSPRRAPCSPPWALKRLPTRKAPTSGTRTASWPTPIPGTTPS